MVCLVDKSTGVEMIPPPPHSSLGQIFHFIKTGNNSLFFSFQNLYQTQIYSVQVNMNYVIVIENSTHYICNDCGTKYFSTA